MARDTQMPTARDDLATGSRPATADSQRADNRPDMTTAERRLPAAMPLHAITTLHGEAGLQERFAIEIASFPDDDRRRAAQALELATRLHASDRRQREPYANHLLRVTIRVITYYGVRDTDVICAALLHDAVEDHTTELATSGERKMHWLRWPRNPGIGWPGWLRRSPTRRTNRDVIVTSSTAST